LIQIKTAISRLWKNATKLIQDRGGFMPVDAMVVSAAVVAMFLALAGVLLWGDLQTRPDRLKDDSNPPKRRSF
jgi:hypothetical protein